MLFLSTPSARRATFPAFCGEGSALVFLSTPSARRATVTRLTKEQLRTYFYPRPPRGGRRLVVNFCVLGLAFLSTPSARRATRTMYRVQTAQTISIHALREEGDAAQTLSDSGET